MKKIRNILFIMADQLRWDYLSCYGHPHLKTPNIDGLAKKDRLRPNQKGQVNQALIVGRLKKSAVSILEEYSLFMFHLF